MSTAHPRKRHVELAVLADVHLGSRGVRAAELLDYLDSVAPETLVIVGDLIDLARLRSRGLPEAHLEVLRAILALAAAGTRVYYLVGNAEAALRPFAGVALGNLHLREELELRVGGERYWMFHGDRLDPVVRLGPALAQLGGPLHRGLVALDRWTARLRRDLGLGHFSLAELLGRSEAYETRYRELFERSALELAAHRGCAYVVCGHSHRPAIRTEELRGRRVTYLNPGDWLHHLTALEFRYGRWELYQYDPDEFPRPSARLRVAESPRHRLRDPLPPAEQALLERVIAAGPAVRSGD